MNRTRFLAGVLGVVVVVAAPSVLPIPSASTFKEETAALRAENDATRQKIELTAAAQEDPTFPGRQAVASARIPAGPDLPGLIDELDAAVTATGMQWTAGAPQNATPSSGAEHVWTMTMNLEGPVSTLPTLLARLGTLQRLVTVDSVTLQRTQGSGVSASVVVRFYAMNATDPLEER